MLFELLGYAAEGKYEGAMQAASALEKEARARKNPNFYVVAAMNRSFAASLLGKYGEGQKHAAEALEEPPVPHEVPRLLHGGARGEIRRGHGHAVGQAAHGMPDGEAEVP